MGLLDKLSQRLSGAGPSEKDAGAAAREEAQRAMKEKRTAQAMEQARQNTAESADSEPAGWPADAEPTAESAGAEPAGWPADAEPTAESAGAEGSHGQGDISGQGGEMGSDDAAALLAGKEPSQVAGGIFFFNSDRMMVIREGGRFIQKQRALRYEQLQSYAMVQDEEVLAQYSRSAIDDMAENDGPAEGISDSPESGDGGKKHCSSLKVILVFQKGLPRVGGNLARYAERRSERRSEKGLMEQSGTTPGEDFGNIAPENSAIDSSSHLLERIEIPFITTKTKIGGLLYRTNRAAADQLIEALRHVVAAHRK